MRLALALALALAGCSVFDPKLYEDRLIVPDGGDDGGDHITNPDMPPVTPLLDRCDGDLPVIMSSTRTFHVDTTSLGDNYSDLLTCTGHEELGNDGFFAIDMKAGERWHIHVHPTPEVDAAFYILPTCDQRTCNIGNGQDACGKGRDEHMSFVAPTNGRYLVGVDSRTAGGGKFEITALQPVCGDNIKVHGEPCDDGNKTPGDGCDERCRVEIVSSPAMETETNDDTFSANVLKLSIPTTEAPTSSMLMRGQLGGRCDSDTYAVYIPAGGSLRATLLDTSGTACTASMPPVKMSFILPDGATVAGTGMLPMGAYCPAIGGGTPFANNVAAAGTYYVRLTPEKDEGVFTYALQVELH